MVNTLHTVAIPTMPAQAPTYTSPWEDLMDLIEGAFGASPPLNLSAC